MKNTALIATIVVAGVAIVIGIAVVSGNPNDNSRSLTSDGGSHPAIVKVQSPLDVDKKSFNFGDVHIYGGKVSTLFTLKNDSSNPITIKQITTSCMCTTATIDGKSFGMDMGSSMTMPPADITIAAKTTMPLTVTFDPLAHGDNATGAISRIVSIETNSSATPLVELNVSGNVVKP